MAPRTLLFAICLACSICLIFFGAGPLPAQSDSGWIPTTTKGGASPAAPSGLSPNTTHVYPKAQPVNGPASASTNNGHGGGAVSGGDFLINGVPYAKVLYQEGNVWIRPPGDMTFRLLADDEPIAAKSILYTGQTGVLDFATGPGMAVRMVPQTAVIVDLLPQPPAAATSKTTTPETSQVAVKKGTIFSALGREDGQPIDFQVRTPQGVAGARGTMFATSASPDQSEVSMLHGTVNFQTPDHQASQITAGQSQQISGSLGGKFQLGQHRALNPSNASEFFNHAGGLLEHACGYGVVRHGLGPDVARTLHDHGYALPAATQQRFQNAATTHYQNKPTFNHASGTSSHPTGTGTSSTTPHPSTTSTYHPSTTSTSHPSSTSSGSSRRLTPQQEKERDGLNRDYQNGGWGRRGGFRSGILGLIPRSRSGVL